MCTAATAEPGARSLVGRTRSVTRCLRWSTRRRRLDLPPPRRHARRAELLVLHEAHPDLAPRDRNAPTGAPTNSS
jgi:hypothetical protein